MAAQSAVLAIAQELGYNIEGDCVSIVAREGNTFVTRILERANRVRRHRAGSKLKITDVKASLVACRAKPLYGYHKNFKVRAYENIGRAGGGDVYLMEDTEEDVNRLRRTHGFSLRAYPEEDYFTFHWLAINGSQPCIPENEMDIMSLIVPDDDNDVGVHGQMELQGHMIGSSHERPTAIVSSNIELPTQLEGLLSEILSGQPKSEHGPDKWRMTLERLRTSPTIQSLVPIILRRITGDMRSATPRELTSGLDLARVLFMNKNIDIDNYIQNFLSIALTVMLTPVFTDGVIAFDDNCWLRQEGADFVSAIIAYAEGKFPEIVERTGEQLLGVLLSEDSPLTTQYGAVLGLQSMGPVARAILLPHVESIVARTKVLKMNPRESPAIRLQAARLLGTLGSTVRTEYSAAVRTKKMSNGSDTAEKFDRLGHLFGYVNTTACGIEDTLEILRRQSRVMPTARPRTAESAPTGATQSIQQRVRTPL